MAVDWLYISETAKTQKLRTRALRKHHYEAMVSDLEACMKCPLSSNGRLVLQTVSPRLLVMIGDAPSRIDFRNREMFSGRPGELIDLGLKHAGLTRSDVTMMNRTVCSTPRPLLASKSEDLFTACRENMKAQLDHTGAWVVLNFENAKDVMKAPKEPAWINGRLVIHAEHPRTAIKNQETKQRFLSRLRLAIQFAFEGEWLVPTQKDLANSSSGRIIIGAVDVAKRIADRGWAVVHSRRIGERYLAVSDVDVEIPDKHQGLVRFTLEELYKIGEFGPSVGISDGDFKAIYEVKRGFAGATLSR